MGYISIWNGYEEGGASFIGCGLYNIKMSSKAVAGPAKAMDPTSVDENGAEVANEDIIDESLFYFKANMLMKTFTIKGDGDRLILYLTYFLSQCVKKVVGLTKDQAKQALHAFANEGFCAPGEKAFPFPAFFPTPKDAAEVDKWKEYMKQLRVEAAVRLIKKVYQFPEADGTGNKFWVVFSKYTLLG
ncbi:ARP2/3 complex subunit, putative [Bodo saltans]|uniref:Actin-related protein 2/3 complex subunit 3 n=1 Tax=Bodo saltans TaxID=75058 RepID=A0A0S4JRW0_BODSA|nr:ARP2/3 complex subunit, putative [Bodo saltans]|eukprot:CUG91261.1 ARP2/3 complex subunit, putative [Bodo saltans]